ncbi:MAG: helix-turn-helix transcriptional regulator [Ilumatobacteraceae bacterium]
MPSADERQDDCTPDETGPGLAAVLPFPSLGRRVVNDAPEQAPAGAVPLRIVIGEVLREERHRQERTLAEVARDAAVSLPYLSEIERGRKDVSSDLLAAVGDALDLTLVEVLDRCVDRLRIDMRGGGTGMRLLAA